MPLHGSWRRRRLLRVTRLIDINITFPRRRNSRPSSQGQMAEEVPARTPACDGNIQENWTFRCV